jgi:hypothetical protein
MVKLAMFGERNTTLSEIEKGSVDNKLRPYIGMSGLGHSCYRYLWFSFRWCFSDSISKRQARLFHRGHREEVEVINALMTAGVKVYGAQTELVDAYGHCKGHVDGLCIGVIEAPKTEHLLEIKTMNDKSFKDTKDKGVKQSKPVYWAQMQLYMLKMKLTRALFVAVNKNDDNIYIERVRADYNEGDALISKAKSLVLEETAPQKVFQSTWYECKYCSARNVCHNGYPIIQTCRSCVNSSPTNNGGWHCGFHDCSLNEKMQRRSCFNYEAIEIA